MKLERQVGTGLMKGGGLFLFREAQRTPRRIKVRAWGILSFQGWPKDLGTTRGHRMREQRHRGLRRRASQGRNGSQCAWMPVKPGEGQRPTLGKPRRALGALYPRHLREVAVTEATAQRVELRS